MVLRIVVIVVMVQGVAPRRVRESDKCRFDSVERRGRRNRRMRGYRCACRPTWW